MRYKWKAEGPGYGRGLEYSLYIWSRILKWDVTRRVSCRLHYRESCANMRRTRLLWYSQQPASSGWPAGFISTFFIYLSYYCLLSRELKTNLGLSQSAVSCYLCQYIISLLLLLLLLLLLVLLLLLITFQINTLLFCFRIFKLVNFLLFLSLFKPSPAESFPLAVPTVGCRPFPISFLPSNQTVLRRVIAHFECTFTVSFDGSWDFGAKQFPGKLLHQRNARASVYNVSSLRTCRTAIMTQCLLSRGRSFRMSGILLSLKVAVYFMLN